MKKKPALKTFFHSDVRWKLESLSISKLLDSSGLIYILKWITTDFFYSFRYCVLCKYWISILAPNYCNGCRTLQCGHVWRSHPVWGILVVWHTEDYQQGRETSSWIRSSSFWPSECQHEHLHGHHQHLHQNCSASCRWRRQEKVKWSVNHSFFSFRFSPLIW